MSTDPIQDIKSTATQLLQQTKDPFARAVIRFCEAISTAGKATKRAGS